MKVNLLIGKKKIKEILKRLLILLRVLNDKLSMVISKKPAISIIIPLYNSQEFVEDCMESLLKQTFNHKRIEVIVVDDGSTDDSHSIVVKYEKKLNLIILQQKNEGASSARNKGLLIAKGKFVVFVDSDDIVPENALNDLHSVIVKYNSDVVIGPRGWIKNNNKVNNYRFDNLFSKPIINKGVKDFPLILGMIAVHSKMFSKQYLINNKMFFREGINSEDFIFTYQMALSTERISTFRDRNVYYYRRRNGENLSITQNRLDLHNIESRFIQMDETYNISRSDFGQEVFKRNEVKINFEHRLYRHLKFLKLGDDKSDIAFDYIRENIIKRMKIIEGNCSNEFVLLFKYMIDNNRKMFYYQLSEIKKNRK